jgi:hypothetical protein
MELVFRFSDVNASNEGGQRVLIESDGKCPACMKAAGKQQNAKRLKKMDVFYIILFFFLILLAAIRVIGTIAVGAWHIFC